MKKCMPALAVILLLMVISCVPKGKLLEKPKERMPTSRDYQSDFNIVWSSVLRTLTEYPLTIIEKESGLINTDWLGRTVKKKVSVWRGLLGGGQVEDEMPVELKERLNILVSVKTDVITNVKIVRYVKVRQYRMTPGGVGNWRPDIRSSFRQTESDTQTEYRLLNEIENNISNK